MITQKTSDSIAPFRPRFIRGGLNPIGELDRYYDIVSLRVLADDPTPRTLNGLDNLLNLLGKEYPLVQALASEADVLNTEAKIPGTEQASLLACYFVQAQAIARIGLSNFN